MADAVTRGVGAATPARDGLAALATVPPRPVDVAAIERELDRLLFEPGAEIEEPQAVGIRACMSNLIVYAPTQADAARIEEALPTVAARHPSRILLLVGESAERDVDAYVSAVCHLGEGGRQVCSEHVRVQGGGDAVRRLPSIARPLLIGDLPTHLWWADTTPPPLGGELFRELSEMAGQVIHDSRRWPDPFRHIAATAEWMMRADDCLGISDLAWARILPWRTLAVQALDTAAVPGAVDSLRQVTIEHGPGGLPDAVLLVGWLAERLGWQPEAAQSRTDDTTTWALASGSGPVRTEVRRRSSGAGRVARVTLAWDAPRAGGIALEALDEGRLGVMDEDGRPRRVVAAPPQDDARLVAQELSDLRRDRIYCGSLAVAGRLARAASD